MGCKGFCEQGRRQCPTPFECDDDDEPPHFVKTSLIAFAIAVTVLAIDLAALWFQGYRP